MILPGALGTPPLQTGLGRVSAICDHRRGKAWVISAIAICLYRQRATSHREILIP